MKWYIERQMNSVDKEINDALVQIKVIITSVSEQNLTIKRLWEKFYSQIAAFTADKNLNPYSANQEPHTKEKLELRNEKLKQLKIVLNKLTSRSEQFKIAQVLVLINELKELDTPTFSEVENQVTPRPILAKRKKGKVRVAVIDEASEDEKSVSEIEKLELNKTKEDSPLRQLASYIFNSEQGEDSKEENQYWNTLSHTLWENNKERDNLITRWSKLENISAAANEKFKKIIDTVPAIENFPTALSQAKDLLLEQEWLPTKRKLQDTWRMLEPWANPIEEKNYLSHIDNYKEPQVAEQIIDDHFSIINKRVMTYSDCRKNLANVLQRLTEKTKEAEAKLKQAKDNHHEDEVNVLNTSHLAEARSAIINASETPEILPAVHFESRLHSIKKETQSVQSALDKIEQDIQKADALSKAREARQNQPPVPMVTPAAPQTIDPHAGAPSAPSFNLTTLQTILQTLLELATARNVRYWGFFAKSKAKKEANGSFIITIQNLLADLKRATYIPDSHAIQDNGNNDSKSIVGIYEDLNKKLESFKVTTQQKGLFGLFSGHLPGSPSKGEQQYLSDCQAQIKQLTK